MLTAHGFLVSEGQCPYEFFRVGKVPESGRGVSSKRIGISPRWIPRRVRAVHKGAVHRMRVSLLTLVGLRGVKAFA